MRKLPGIIALVLMTTPAVATPPNMVCEVSEPPLNIEINLSTNYSDLNPYGIVPGSLVYSGLTIDPPQEGIPASKISLYGEDMVGQWLLDGRIDLQFYKEESLDNGEVLSISLTIKTTSTGKTKEESGQPIHRGTYELQFFAGSKRENVGKLIRQFAGNIICG